MKASWKSLALLVSLGMASMAFSQSGDDPYVALAKGPIYVHPSAKEKVNVAEITSLAKKLEPTKLKVLVVPSLGAKWRDKTGKEMRGSYAKHTFEKTLTLKNGILIVYTKSGITGYSDILKPDDLAPLINDSRSRVDANNFTPAITWLAQSIYDRKAEAKTTKAVTTGGLLTMAGIGVGVAGLVVLGAKAAKMKAARTSLEKHKDRVLEEISYLDAYQDLLPNPEAQRTVRSYRERAADLYQAGLMKESTAKRPEEIEAVSQEYVAAFAEAARGRPVIDSATSGTSIAMLAPPVLTADQRAQWRPNPMAPVFEPVAGACYFCSRPDNGDASPLEMVMDGKRRTVMTCPDCAASARAGHEPQVRGQYNRGQFVPWYMTPGYNPHSMYGSGSFVWDMMAMSAMMHMFNPFGHIGLIHGFYGSHGFTGSDFAGSSWGDPSGLGADSVLNNAGDFGGSDFGGFDGGGGDFGGGDFGGGDFGGGDFGGGGD
jgi:hypothetical protein